MVQKILRTMQDDLKEAKEKKQKGETSKENLASHSLKAEIKESVRDDLQQESSAYNKAKEAFKTKEETPALSSLEAFDLVSSKFAYQSENKEDRKENEGVRKNKENKDAQEIRNELEELSTKIPKIDEELLKTPPAFIEEAPEVKPEETAKPKIEIEASMDIPLEAKEERPVEKSAQETTIDTKPLEIEPEDRATEELEPEILMTSPYEPKEEPAEIAKEVKEEIVPSPQETTEDITASEPLNELLLSGETAKEENETTKMLETENLLPAGPAPETELSTENEQTTGQIANETVPTQPYKQDEEFSSLLKRVSQSMEGKVTKNPDVSDAIKKPEKDRELKDLITRISKNLEKEKELLRTEKKSIAAIEPDAVRNIEPEPSQAKTIEDDYRPRESKNEPIPEKPADSYWNDIHSTLKNQNEEQPQQETEAAGMPRKNIGAEPDIEREEAGLITPETEEDDVRKKLVFQKQNDSYVAPENRLVSGKQEYYSSLHKRIIPKGEGENLENLKDIVKEKEIKLSDEEEKKMLRKQIIKKYDIKLFTLPWAKIIIFTILLLGTIGITLYMVIPKLKAPAPAPEQILTGESIAEIDGLISQEVPVKEDTVKTLNYFDSDMDPWSSLSEQGIVRLKVDYSNHDIMLPRDDALKAVLGEEHFSSIPSSVWSLIGSKYDILAFKNNGTLRLGLVLQYDQGDETNLQENMLGWEETQIKSEKIYSVFKNLFINDKVDDKGGLIFQQGTYNGIDIHYINLPDTNTSMDYFTYKGMIVFTTSKDTTFEMIDLLNR